jgi:molecular chaperone DnaJ
VADHYAALGVSRDASADEIKKAYRRLARELHPDATPGDAAAEARFKEVAHAYEVLCDPERRARYDRFGTDEPGGGGDPFGFGDGGGLGDIFNAFFGGAGGGFAGQAQSGPPRGSDLEVVLDLTLEEAVFGTQAPVQVRTAVPCGDCTGSGAAAGTEPATCPQCQGAGQVRRVRQSILGQMVTAGPCDRCNAMGTIVETPCATCRGEGRVVEERTYQLDVPAGIDNGQAVRLSGRGAVGPRRGAPGDLYVHVRVAPHERFERHGHDLVHELHLSFTQAALGAAMKLETLDGEEQLVIDRGTQSGRVLRLRSRGVPKPNGRRGDLLVSVVVDTPTSLSDDEDALLRQLAELRGEEVAPADEGFFAKLKSAFR